MFETVSSHHVARCSLELPHQWIRPIVPGFLDEPVHPVSPQIPGVGVNHGVLHLLNQARHLPSKPLPIRMALINVRSLVNKTFILHDFFTAEILDIIFITELQVHYTHHPS